MDRIEAIRNALAVFIDSREALMNMTISDLNRVLDGFTARGLRVSFSASRNLGNVSDSVEVTLSIEAPEIEIKAAIARLSTFAESVRRDVTIGNIADALIAFEYDLFSHVPCPSQSSIECMRIADIDRNITLNYRDFAMDICPNRGYNVEIYGHDYSLVVRHASGEVLRPIDFIESFRKHVKPLLINPLA